MVFQAEALLPEAWKSFNAQGPARTFNPGLLCDTAGWLFAYRIVGADGARRLGLCRLDERLQIVEGTQLPWSDGVRFRPGAKYPEIATRWFADPRLYRLGGRLFVYWNSGWHEPQNHQFLIEIDAATLRPIGYARELVLRGERRKLEKNWTLFETEQGECRAIYSILPHRVLAFSLEGAGDIEFEEIARVEWSLPDYPANHGGLRGGAPPVRVEDTFWSFCHSVHDGMNGYRYVPAVYAFASSPAFRPVAVPIRPLDIGSTFGSSRMHPRLNPAVAEVIYPCGAARDGTRWLISHGINDESCGISIVDHADVLATLQPASRAREP